MAEVIGVKFKNTAKVYYFSPAKGIKEYPEKAGVVVETTKGLEYGTIVFGVKTVSDESVTHPLKPIVRLANKKDEQRVTENNEKIPYAMDKAREKIAELSLNMKLIGAEYSFDGKKLTFYFSAEDRVDFRELVKHLAAEFKLRIELRQVGIRAETKILGGIAPCGRTCCCAGTMNDFAKVSIKMAKNQGLHLNPSKISGLCGRLMCCLEYENDYYEKAYKQMPKMGGTVKSPEGEGVVVANDMLKMISRLKIQKPDGSEVYKDFNVKDLEFKRKSCEECKNCDNSAEETDSDNEELNENFKNEE